MTTRAANVLDPREDIEPYEAIPAARPNSAEVRPPADYEWSPREAMLLPAVSRRACAFDLLLFVVYTSGCGYVIRDALHRFADPYAVAGEDPRPMNVVLTLGFAVLSLVLVGLFTGMRGLGPASLGLSRVHLGSNLLLGLPTTVASFAVFYLGVAAVWVLWPAGFEEMMSNPERISRTLPRMSIPAIVGMMAVVGFYEEVVFRGFLLTRLRRLIGSWAVAIVVAALVFTVPHLTMQATPTAVPLFGLAVLWSVITWWRRSLIPCVIGHALFNTVQLVGMSYTNPQWN